MLNIALGDDDLPSDWIILGQTFFKDFVLAIDYDNNIFSIGLSKKAHYGAEVNGHGLPKPDDSGSGGSSWWWIILLIIVGLLLLLIILYLIYRCMKKGNSDLDESQDPYAHEKVKNDISYSEDN